MRLHQLGKTFYCSSGYASKVRTGTRRIMRLDELSFEIRLERRTTKGSSSGRVVHPSCARLYAKDA